MSTDSRPETYAHINEVQRNLTTFATKLLERGLVHDQTKLKSPEVELFDEYTARLAGCTYNSPEYKGFLAQLKPALDHHYAKNTHHPEHYPDGIRGMSLLDLVEMLCDWKAATTRHNDGNLVKSIITNQQRFGFSDELKQILLNTLVHLE